ncbi:hypothetical protein ABPG74_018903 [Tetrahymena malaccensis]
MQSGSTTFFTQYFFPQLAYPCSNYIVQKLQGYYYLLCVQSSNYYVICEKSFDLLFTSTNLAFSNFQNPTDSFYFYNQYIQMQRQYIFMNGKKYTQQTIGRVYLINQKYNLYFQQGLIVQLSFSNDQAIIVKQITKFFNNYSEVIQFPQKAFILVQQNSSPNYSIQIYDIDDFLQIQTFGDSFPINLPLNQKYYQYNNFIFLGNNYYELIYFEQLNKIQIKSYVISNGKIYLSNNSPLDFLFNQGFGSNVSTGTTKQYASIQQMYNMIPGCSLYVDNTISMCKQCAQFYFLQNGRCLTACEDGFYSSGTTCLPCNQTCKTCNGPSTTNCLTCNEDQYLFLDNSCCDCNQVGQKITDQNCQCIENYNFYNSVCTQTYLDYNSNAFTQEFQQQLNQSTQISMQVSLVTTTFLSAVQNIFSQSSFGIVMSGLTCLKLSYLSLVSSILPQQIFSPLKIVSDKCPPQQFSKLNIFAQLFKQSDSQYQNNQYENFGLSFNILKTSGQAILVIVMFVLGINQQIKQFGYDFDSNNIGVEITFLLLIIPVTVIILQQQYQYLNKPKPSKKVPSFSEITREKIQNEAIFESKIRRNFMIIFQIIESIFIPICFIQFTIQIYQYFKQKKKSPEQQDSQSNFQIEFIPKQLASNDLSEIRDIQDASTGINQQNQFKIFNLYEKMFKKKQNQQDQQKQKEII